MEATILLTWFLKQSVNFITAAIFSLEKFASSCPVEHVVVYLELTWRDVIQRQAEQHENYLDEDEDDKPSVMVCNKF